MSKQIAQPARLPERHGRTAILRRNEIDDASVSKCPAEVWPQVARQQDAVVSVSLAEMGGIIQDVTSFVVAGGALCFENGR
jgi:hypothetical protein